jgi:hypothetical protein
MLGFAGLTPAQLGSAMALLGRCVDEVTPVVIPVGED